MVSDDMLSQDEIDALLKGGDDEDTFEQEYTPSVEDYLSSIEQDALGEVGNISFGSSATALSTLLNQKVEITTPSVSAILMTRLQEEFPEPYVAVEVEYTDGFKGTNLLVIQRSDAAIIADLMLGGDGVNPSEDLGEIQLSAVQEAMNQMMGSSATSMSTVFSKKVDISPPKIDILNVKEGDGTDRIPEEDVLIKISFELRIGELIDSNIMQLLPVDFSKELVDSLMNPSGGEVASKAKLPKREMPIRQEQEQVQETKIMQDTSTPQIQQQMQSQQMSQPYPSHGVQEQPVYNQPVAQAGYYQQPPPMQMPPQPSGPQHIGANSYGQGADVQTAEFSSFTAPNLQPQEASNLNMLLDIPLQVTVELGRTKRSVQEILELSPGSIVELDKLAGEPVDILVNNKLIATGEVVVIEENFGVRVTDIISQKERMKKLQ
ncbi:flagellar motor switch phosphatase FliY [Bacillus solimangrovi]|uniref:Flagellar motor switch protein FliN n=1 Tax=Bacillus solimangrovi TaxID=1305675 RepID=A0A1E5LB13_9BACI|nr:flagellar motor switch phosphatase FliY [Bacillus solimangrovi]OEH91271.1 flagellar motor switch phosphatase FliY [Bacillus solimangrovi]